MGLIAGGGRLPVLIAQSLRALGHPVHGLGLADQFEPELPDICSSFRPVGLLRIGTWGRILSKLGVHHAIMVGRVDKAKLMHDPWRVFKYLPDWAAVTTWYKLRHDRRSHAMLNALAEQLDRCGVTLLDSTAPIPNEMATAGVMTRTQPTSRQRSDIEFAWPLLSETLRLDIGQAVAVRERDVIAVEAVEGTDAMIERTGALCKASGWTLLKTARAGHDMRADVPTVGVRTIDKLAAAGAGCLALGVGRVILVDRPAVLAAADRAGIALVGVHMSGRARE